MSTLLLTKGRCTAVLYSGPAPEPTHSVRFTVTYLMPDSPRHQLGNLLATLEDRDSLLRITTLQRYLQHKFPRAHVELYWQELGAAKERRRLSDVQRFRIRMGKVLRAYDAELAAIRAGDRGLFREELELQLNKDLEAAWAKAEQLFRCKKEEYYNTSA